MKTLLIAATLFVSATYSYAAPGKTTTTKSTSTKSAPVIKSTTTNKSTTVLNKSGTTNKVIHNINNHNNHNTNKVIQNHNHNNKVIHTNKSTKSVSVFAGKTHHAKNYTQFAKTFHGHRCFARTYCGWTHRCWLPRFGCFCYYCPSTRGWFYLYAAGDCYMPVDAAPNFPPTPNDTGDTGDNGIPALPEGAEPIDEGTPPLPPQ